MPQIHFLAKFYLKMMCHIIFHQNDARYGQMMLPSDILVKNGVTHYFRIEFCKESRGMGYF